MSPRDEPIHSSEQNSCDQNVPISRIFLIRHGDRFDYANPSWAANAKANGALVTDPPLSALGHVQATETAAYVSQRTRLLYRDGNGNKKDEEEEGISNSTAVPRHGVSKILTSPYLRVIQTAVPTANALGLPLSIEWGLAEAHATPGMGILPLARERFAYFPQIDPSYESLQVVKSTSGCYCHRTGHPCEAFAGRFVQRMQAFAQTLESQYYGETVVCFSHAASTALVAAMLKCSLREPQFAPCGVYELQRKGKGPWELLRSGESNQPYVSENSSTTYPWGFGRKHFQEDGKYFGCSENIGLDYFVQQPQN